MEELNNLLKRFEKSLNIKIFFGVLLMTCSLIIMFYKPTIRIFPVPKEVEVVILNQKKLIEKSPVHTELEKTLQQSSLRYLYLNQLQLKLAMRAFESILLINSWVLGMLILSYGMSEKIFFKKFKRCLNNVERTVEQ